MKPTSFPKERKDSSKVSSSNDRGDPLSSGWNATVPFDGSGWFIRIFRMAYHNSQVTGPYPLVSAQLRLLSGTMERMEISLPHAILLICSEFIIRFKCHFVMKKHQQGKKEEEVGPRQERWLNSCKTSNRLNQRWRPLWSRCGADHFGLHLAIAWKQGLNGALEAQFWQLVDV